MSFIEIEPFVTKAERQSFLFRIDESDWYHHKSTVSGRQSPLQFKPIIYRGVSACLMKMDPNTIQEWHTDSVKMQRNTLILHPLTENYSPFMGKDGSSTKPIIANAQSKHAVFNNENIRLNLQIPFPNAFDDVHADKNSVVWKLLNRFYKENNEQR